MYYSALMLRILTFVLALCCSGIVFAQSEYTVSGNTKMKESEGKEFWLCFMRNYREVADATANDQLTLQLFFTANITAKVRVEIEGISYQRTVIVNGGTVASIIVDEHAQLNAVATPQRLAVHITSDEPITVYGLNRRYQTTDTYLALPVTVLGKEYRAVCYNDLSQDLVSQIAVVATEDNTVLTITPRCGVIGGFKADRPYTMRMRKGDAYQIIADYHSSGTGDLSGTLIKSNTPVSVFSGHSCAYVPSGIQACNHLVEQLPPVTAWGKHFYIGMLKGRSRYTVRVVAHEERTRVFEDSKLVAVLSAGDFYEMVNVRKHMQVTADKPILVAQYSQGFKNGDSIGDPMMILVSPTQQFVRKYRVATPVNGLWDHFINIIAPTDYISTLRVDGSPVPLSKFEPFGLSRFSVAQLSVAFGTHLVTGDVPFGLYSYGFGYRDDAFDAYGNMGGQSFFDLENSRDTLPPVPEVQLNSGVVIRDDRNSDRGLKTVSVLQSVGLRASVPTLEEGAPQLVIALKPVSTNEAGTALIRAIDVAGNAATFTVCYSPDAGTGSGTFSVGDEDRTCITKPQWYAGTFVTTGLVRHDASFGTTANVSANGTFGDATGSGGLFGLSLTRELDDDWSYSARLALETIGGTLRAPDSVVTRIRDSSGALLNFQEERSIRLSSPFLALSLVAQHTVFSRVYAYAGLKAHVLMSNSVEYKQRILQPQNAVYADTRLAEREILLDGFTALRTLRFSALAGAGGSVPLGSALSLFAEAEYVAPLTSVIESPGGSWTIRAIEVHIGLRMAF
jgi:hypothetical protein